MSEDVLRFFARLANHETSRTHPERPRTGYNVQHCAYCETAQMFENMMVVPCVSSRRMRRH